LFIFYRQILILRPLNFYWSASTLYKQLCRPLFFSNVLDLILFGTNKGDCSCSPCHHFHTFPDCGDGCHGVIADQVFLFLKKMIFFSFLISQVCI
jgi:hypothetical protein